MSMAVIRVRGVQNSEPRRLASAAPGHQDVYILAVGPIREIQMELVSRAAFDDLRAVSEMIQIPLLGRVRKGFVERTKIHLVRR